MQLKGPSSAPFDLDDPPEAVTEIGLRGFFGGHRPPS